MLTAWPTIAYAASVTTGIAGLTADSSGDGKWSSSNGTITGSVSPKSSSGCTSTSYSAQTGKLTLENSTDYRANLSIYISITKASGSITLGQDKIEAADTHIVALDPGQTIVIEITSGASEGATTGIAISDISLTPITDIDTTFNPAQNGNYTVDGETISEIITKTKSSDVSYSLVATPDKGYKFLRWYDAETNATLSTTPSTSLYSLEPRTISAEFVSADTPVFDVDTTFFTDLNQAVAYAQSNNKSKITLISDGTLPAGDYTIPSGKTLLIPFDEAQTLYTTKPDVVYGSHANPSAFRTLTMTDGANITVENGGAISVGSKLSATGTGSGSWNGTPTDKHGRIHMSSGSSITLNSGAALYAYGYISGSGSVTANSGSEVWECFQIRCWRGGTATSGMADNSQKVFPLNQYYVQNIEAPLTLHAGAVEKVYTAVNMSSQAFAASAQFIGTGGMFNPSGSITKRYEGAADRIAFDIEGDATLRPMSLRITGLPLIGTLDLDTSDYALPINSNITINVKSGTTILDGQDIALLPSAELNIASGATAEIGGGSKPSNLYVYDKDQWGPYAVSGSQLVPVGYSTVNGTTAKRTAAGLSDAVVDINGTLNVKGQFYTTESGASVISSDATGKVIQAAAPGSQTKTHQATQSGSSMTYAEIPITAAQLQNADGTYVKTSDSHAGDEIPYTVNRWGTGESIKVTFDKNEANATGEMSDLNGTSGKELELTPNAFEYEGHTFTGWNTEADGSGESYANKAKVTLDADTTLYAQWETSKYTIKFVNDDANSTVLQESLVEHGTMPEYTGEIPTKDGTAQYTYTFDGWNSEIVAATADATYKATYTAETNKYTVKFVDENGDEIKSDELEYGAAIVAPEAPTKESTAQYTFAFDGWYDGETKLGENDVVVGNATYAPRFTKTVNTYTITWNIEGTKTEQTYEYGATPVYSGEEPTKEGGEEFTYTFAGWSPEIATVTGDAEYLAQFKEVKNSYTITFKNEDGTVLQSTEVEYGETPSFNSDTPTKASTDQYTYTFDKWTPEVTAVTGEAEYTATYTKTVNEYTITWLNDDGTQIDTTTVAYGEVPTHPDAVKYPDAQYTYTFDKWTPEVVSVTGDATYTATYTNTVNKYEVKWVNEDGTLLKTDEVEYGNKPVYEDETHQTPTKPDTEEYTYAFAGWSPTVGEVTGDVTYKATYSKSDKLYNVIWVDDVIDPETQKPVVLKTAEGVKYNGIPAYEDADHEIPTKDADAQYTYTFKEWAQTLDPDTLTYTLTAVYDKVVNTYTVTWANYDGVTIETDENIPYGEMPEFNGANPTRDADAQYTYSFKGWNKTIEKVTGDVTYTAEYNMAVNAYTITFVDDGDVVLLTKTLEYGVMPEYTGEAPAKAETFNATYTFAGWTPTIEVVTGEATYKAQFNELLKNGWTQWEGNTYFMINGEPVKGLYTTESQDGSHEGTFAFDPKTGVFLSGLNDVNEFEGEIYFFKAGEVQKNKGLTRVIKDGQILYYYFQEDGKAVRDVPEGGQDFWVENANGLALPKWGYFFNEDGTIIHNADTSLYGIHADENGVLCYYIDGVKAHVGMVKVGDDYYYAKSRGNLVVGTSYYCTDVNSTGLEPGTYTFDAQGRMVVEQPDDRTGIFEEDGSLYYYEHGKRTYAGLIEIDGSYYYVKTSGEVVHGQRYWISKTNGLKPEASYEFDGQGRMVDAQAEPKNGFYEEDGTLWYYVDGAKSYAGLIEVDGSYYYVKTSGEVVRGRSYWITKTNDLLPEASYEFADDGKIVLPKEPDPSETKQGIVAEDGSLYYYENGQRTYAGVFELDGSYYYAKTNGEVVHGRSYWISKTNGLVAEKSYAFAEDGKMAV